MFVLVALAAHVGHCWRASLTILHQVRMANTGRARPFLIRFTDSDPHLQPFLKHRIFSS
jgi:hypothetical protein